MLLVKQPSALAGKLSFVEPLYLFRNRLLNGLASTARNSLSDQLIQTGEAKSDPLK
jgi:hypothetical protein